MADLQKEIQKAIEKSTINGTKLEEVLNRPVYEFVETYKLGRFTRYIGS